MNDSLLRSAARKERRPTTSVRKKSRIHSSSRATNAPRCITVAACSARRKAFTARHHDQPLNTALALAHPPQYAGMMGQDVGDRAASLPSWQFSSLRCCVSWAISILPHTPRGITNAIGRFAAPLPRDPLSACFRRFSGGNRAASTNSVVLAC